MQRAAPEQSGSVLLEGLISIVIFSVGLLALLALLGTALKLSGDAKYRADGSYLASQLIATMWTDRSAGNYSGYAHYATPGTSVCAPAGSASSNANVVAWLSDVAAALPGATANRQQIVVNPSGVVTVTVCWQAPNESAPHNVVTSAQIAFN